MRVLQICSKPAVPEIDGGCLATNALTQALLNCGVQVDILTIATQKHPITQETIDYYQKKKIAFDSVYINTKPKPLAAFLNLFSKKSYNIERFVSETFSNVIIEKLKKYSYDYILIEGLYVSMYMTEIKTHSKALILYREHNIEYRIWQQISKKTISFKKLYVKLLAKKLKRYEYNFLKSIKYVLAISQIDLDFIKKINPNLSNSIVIPFGYKKDITPITLADNYSLCHIGAMDWQPNIHGVNWLIKNVIPQLNNTPLYLAGKKIPAKYSNLSNNNIYSLGEVENAEEFITQHNIMLVPLFTGSGMRIKVIEAMALGRVVIGTNKAFEGITVTHKENAIIANTAQEFIKYINYCKEHPANAQLIANNAQTFIKKHFYYKVIEQKLFSFLKDLLNSQ